MTLQFDPQAMIDQIDATFDEAENRARYGDNYYQAPEAEADEQPVEREEIDRDALIADVALGRVPVNVLAQADAYDREAPSQHDLNVGILNYLSAQGESMEQLRQRERAADTDELLNSSVFAAWKAANR